MHLAGKGVDENIVTASAWYRLAAERGDDVFVRERDKIMTMLNENEQKQSDQAYVELCGKLGDVTLIVNLIEQDLRTLRLGGEPNLLMPAYAGRTDLNRDTLTQAQTAKRISARMRYIEEKLAADTLVNESERQRFENLERRVTKELERFAGSR